MDIATLSRLVENLIRIGTIHSVDHAKKRCRVQSGKNTTQWLRWFESRAGETTTWNPPTVGEQCVVISPSGVLENGIVFYGVPSDVIDTPSHDENKHVIAYPDGARIEYDHADGHLSATGIDVARIQASTFCQVDCPSSEFTGDVLVKGTLTVVQLFTYMNGMAGTGGENGNAITGNLTHTDGELSSNGIVLDKHGHDEIVRGGDVSGGPVSL